MADENFPAPAPIIFDDQILPFAVWVPIGKSNYVLDLQKKQKNPIFQIFVDILQNTNFFRAFNALASLDETQFVLDANLLREALEITPIDQAHQFVSPPSGDAIIDFVNELGYTEARLLDMIGPNTQFFRSEKAEKKKPATAKQPTPKPDKEKSSEPTPAPKPKVTKEISSKPSPAKHPKRGEGEVYDVEHAIQMSLESFQAIRESVAEATRLLPVVEATEEASTGPSTQPQDDTSTNIVCDSLSHADAETGADTNMTNSRGDTEILQFSDEQGNDVTEVVNLKDKTTEIDEGQARSDPGKTPESRRPPDDNKINEDQAGPDLKESHVDLGRLNLEPTYDEFMANVYPKFHKSLKFPADEHVILEDPPTLTGTLPSMKNLEDAYTIGDQFFNDKSTKDKPGKLNVEAEVVSMVTVPIYQVSSLVPLLSTPIIDLSPPKLAPSTTQVPIFTATTTTTTTTHLLPPPPQQQSIADSELNLGSRVFTLELRDLPYKIDETVYEAVKEIKPRLEWLKPIPEEDRPESPKPDWSVPSNDLPEPKNSWANALANSYKDLEENKLLWKTSDMGSFITWFCKRIGKKKLNKRVLPNALNQVDLVNPDGHRLVPDVSKPLPLGGPPCQVTIQSQIFFKKDLEYLMSVPTLWIKSEREYDISAAYGISHWWFKRKEFYITRHSAPSDRSTVRSHMRVLNVVSLKTYARYGYSFLKEIVLRRADYKEYKISKADFKNLHPNDFKDLYLLHL
ncbi:hypothetical protein Tco_0445406 [Tanacetum coccineum]